MGEEALSVLVVDDDSAVASVLTALLQQDGFAAESRASAQPALALIALGGVDLLITDLRMPGMDGMELLSESLGRFPDVPVIVVTAHGSVPLAVQAMKAGAADFILKPFDRQEILFSVRKALANAPRAASTTREMVGGSDPMLGVQDLIDRAARSDATVLVRGESGTGKELAARAVHLRSRRRDSPFVKVHCAALPDELLASELFGYEKGAFTGAVCRKPGRVDLAGGGTLFLDEIGDVNANVQVKLLQLLQDREYERLGGTERLKADMRFVAATHRPLEEMVKAGTFREDLYYRLNVVPIRMPPLRERPRDIAPLAVSFCSTLASPGRPQFAINADAISLLETAPWPGNVRQLQNFVERLLVFSNGPSIARADVEREFARERSDNPAPTSTGTLDSRRRDGEREAMREALQRAEGNRTLAARLLGVSRRTLYTKLNEYGLE